MFSTLYTSTLPANTENTAPVLYFSTWLLYHVLRLMIRYILSGFELELFSVHEYPYLYWYLYELLYPWLTTCLHKADSHLQEYEQYLENQSKSNPGGKKPKKNNKNKTKKLPRPYVKELTNCQAFATLCSGYFKVSKYALNFDLRVILSFRSSFSTLRFGLKIKSFAKQNMFYRLHILHDFSISSFLS